MSDPLAVNKILAGFLCACLILIGSSKFASFMQGSDSKHHGSHDKEEIHSSNAYPISVPENLDQGKLISPKVPTPIAPILALISSADIAAGEKLSKKCVACHSFNAEGKNKVGPNLWNIINKPKASKDGYSYSKALEQFGGDWDYKSLNAFLLKPKNYIEGTKMNFAGLKKTNDRANIIAWLRSLSDNPQPLPTDDEIKSEANESSQ